MGALLSLIFALQWINPEQAAKNAKAADTLRRPDLSQVIQSSTKYPKPISQWPHDKRMSQGLTEEVEPDDFKLSSISIYTFGGMGMGFSVEYERKLNKKYAGWGVRAGVGIAGFDISYSSIPIQINYLFGKGNSYLEIGAGVTYLRNNDRSNSNDFELLGIKFPSTPKDFFLPTFTLGYRGFFEWRGPSVFRVGITPCYLYPSIVPVPFIDVEFQL